MPAQGTALGIGSRVENSNALKGQNRFVVKNLVSPFQGWADFHSDQIPRALPWAFLFRPLPSRHMSGRLTRSQKKSPTNRNTDQKRRSDLCFGRLIRTICCPAARHMSGSSGRQKSATPKFARGGKSAASGLFSPLRRGDTGRFFECLCVAPGSASRRLKTALIFFETVASFLVDSAVR